MSGLELQTKVHTKVRYHRGGPYFGLLLVESTFLRHTTLTTHYHDPQAALRFYANQTLSLMSPSRSLRDCEIFAKLCLISAWRSSQTMMVARPGVPMTRGPLTRSLTINLSRDWDQRPPSFWTIALVLHSLSTHLQLASLQIRLDFWVAQPKMHNQHREISRSLKLFW